MLRSHLGHVAGEGGSWRRRTPARSSRMTTWTHSSPCSNLVRTGKAGTRPALKACSGYGRAVVSQRVTRLIDCGLIEEGSLGPSTGGRPSRKLYLRSDTGVVLAAALGATSISVGITDLSGNLLGHHEEPNDVAVGPERTLSRVEELFDKMLATGTGGGKDIWGIGIGVPGPVEFSAGRPVSPPIMPGWDGYPVGQRLATRYRAAAWVDNDVNLMALGELRAGLAQNETERRLHQDRQRNRRRPDLRRTPAPRGARCRRRRRPRSGGRLRTRSPAGAATPGAWRRSRAVPPSLATRPKPPGRAAARSWPIVSLNATD